jgi:hypothetical protein
MVVGKWLVKWLNYREVWVDLWVAQLVETLCYDAESGGFDSPVCRWDLSLTFYFCLSYGLGIVSDAKENEQQTYLRDG